MVLLFKFADLLNKFITALKGRYALCKQDNFVCSTILCALHSTVIPLKV